MLGLKLKHVSIGGPRVTSRSRVWIIKGHLYTWTSTHRIPCQQGFFSGFSMGISVQLRYVILQYGNKTLVKHTHIKLTALQWYHNECDGVSNHRSLDCLLNRFLQAQLKKHQSSASLASMRGINWWPVNYPHKGPVTWIIFPVDNVIMDYVRNS